MHRPSRSSHYSQLQPEDRVTIASLRQQNYSVRAIARQLLRSPATISRELLRNAHPSGYGSARAQRLSLQRRRCGRPAGKLHPDSVLWGLVGHLLRLHWSPEQIALTLARLHPPGHEHRVSYETIYNCIYAMPVGELRKELIATLRHAHNKRVPQQRQGPQGPDPGHAEHPCTPSRDPRPPVPRALGRRADQRRGQCQCQCGRDFGGTHQPAGDARQTPRVQAGKRCQRPAGLYGQAAEHCPADAPEHDVRPGSRDEHAQEAQRANGGSRCTSATRTAPGKGAPTRT